MKGWAVRGCDDPRAVAVLVGRRFVFLTDGGDYEELPPEAE